MKKLLNYDFEFVQGIVPVMDSSGKIKEFILKNFIKRKMLFHLINMGKEHFVSLK